MHSEIEDKEQLYIYETPHNDVFNIIMCDKHRKELKETRLEFWRIDSADRDAECDFCTEQDYIDNYR